MKYSWETIVLRWNEWFFYCRHTWQAPVRRKCRSPQAGRTSGASSTLIDPWGTLPRREDSKSSEPESWGDFKSLTEAPIARLESLDEMESLPVSVNALPSLSPLVAQREDCTVISSHLMFCLHSIVAWHISLYLFFFSIHQIYSSSSLLYLAYCSFVWYPTSEVGFFFFSREFVSRFFNPKVFFEYWWRFILWKIP